MAVIEAIPGRRFYAIWFFDTMEKVQFENKISRFDVLASVWKDEDGDFVEIIYRIRYHGDITDPTHPNYFDQDIKKVFPFRAAIKEDDTEEMINELIDHSIKSMNNLFSNLTSTFENSKIQFTDFRKEDPKGADSDRIIEFLQESDFTTIQSFKKEEEEKENS